MINNLEPLYIRSGKNYIKNSYLILFTFATAFFPRIISTFINALAPINFLHFASVILLTFTTIFTTKVKSRQQILISKQIILGLFLLLLICSASAFFNKTGVINIILSFLMLAEPFMLLLAIICIPMSYLSFEKLQSWLTRFLFLHIFLIYFQFFVLRYHFLPGYYDNIQGVFYRSGSGHVVGASVSTSFAAYYFMMFKSQALWKRVLVVGLSFGNVILSDAKQVIVVFVVAYLLLAFFELKDLRKSILYLSATIIFIILFSWAVNSFEFLASYKTWIRPEIYEYPDGEANKLKLSGIRIILAHYHSNWNWFLGLGPGQTIGRLGGWMLRDYSNLLMPLGATQSSIGDEVWNYVASSWLAEGSSFFLPFWGWAGIWGDLGFLGLGVYLYLASIVWCQLCTDRFAKLMMLTVFVHGLIFTQMEEPGFMLLIAMLIGLNWQQKHIENSLLRKNNLLLS
jgi:hypothetical protein